MNPANDRLIGHSNFHSDYPDIMSRFAWSIVSNLFSLFVVFLAMPVKGVLFPPAGVDVLDGTAYLEIDLTPSFGMILLAELSGPTEVHRGIPYPDNSHGGDEANARK